MSALLRQVLDSAKLIGGYGRPSAGSLQVMHGFNRRGSASNIVPPNVDNQGYTFFTKPNLNLSYDNVTAHRRMYFLANDDPSTMAAAIRCTLSPKLSIQTYEGWKLTSNPEDPLLTSRSNVVDDRNAFIPLLSNTLINLSGWPEKLAEVMETAPGIRKEVVGWLDSFADEYSSFELQANFQNIDGDPVNVLFAAWLEYGLRVAEGSMYPYPIQIVENEIDYQTRIYRLSLDETKTWVQKLACTGISFPTSSPLGASFDFNRDSAYIDMNNQLSVRMYSLGYWYNDPAAVYAFNRTVQEFNPSMRDTSRKDAFIKIPPNEQYVFNYHGYPRISETNELEWWLDKETYNNIKAGIADVESARKLVAELLPSSPLTVA